MEEPLKIPSVKIALIGNEGVGKTCIIERFSKGIFSDVKATVGIGFTQKYLKINNQTIQCNLWDTSGQEKYRNIGKESYKDAYIVCLVYDITNNKSFEDIKDIWISNLKKYGEKNVILAIVGNKNDLYENEKVDENKAREYAKSINASFFLTSAKSGENIDSLFENLVKKYLNPEFIIKINSLNGENIENFDLENVNVDKKKKGCCCCTIF